MVRELSLIAGIDGVPGVTRDLTEMSPSGRFSGSSPGRPSPLERMEIGEGFLNTAKKWRHQEALVWMAFTGATAGAALNLAFGSTFWNLEGILGGLCAGALIFLFS